MRSPLVKDHEQTLRSFALACLELQMLTLCSRGADIGRRLLDSLSYLVPNKAAIHFIFFGLWCLQ